MNHIVIDFEMNRIPKKLSSQYGRLKNEIIEIGAVRLNDEMNIQNRFDIYVMPQYNSRITPVVSDITGITMELLQEEKAVFFEEAMEQFLEWIGDEPSKFYSWSDTDRTQLFSECEQKLKNSFDVLNHFRRWLDLQKIFSRLMGSSNPISLVNALSMTRKFFQGMEHSAVDEAENTAHVVMLIKDKENFEE